MNDADTSFKIPDSERAPAPGARLLGPARLDQQVRVSVILRRKPSAPPLPVVLAAGNRRTSDRIFVKRTEFADRYGADAGDLATLDEFARAQGLTVVESSAARRTVVLSGTVAVFNRAFGVALATYQLGDGTYHGHPGPVSLPAGLSQIVVAVLGLDDRPVARPRSWTVDHGKISDSIAYSPFDVAKAYNFPRGNLGQGECIGIIELGGGYLESDLDQFFSGHQRPSVVSKSAGSQNNPGVDGGADEEVAMDIQIAGACAPRASIVVYFSDPSDGGFYNALTTAIHDADHNPSVISISWGKAEVQCSSNYMQSMNDALQEAAAMGVTVTTAVGDDGSSDFGGDRLAHVDFPSSSPYALGCGGTTLDIQDGTIIGEVVWNDSHGVTGGGVSDNFAIPGWQTAVGVPVDLDNPHVQAGRGVPDVAGHANGYLIIFRGKITFVKGTSTVAPLYAGLIAIINSNAGTSSGYVNQILCASPWAFRDITIGGNGAFQAKPGWDPCTGLGSPRGIAIGRAIMNWHHDDLTANAAVGPRPLQDPPTPLGSYGWTGTGEQVVYLFRGKGGMHVAQLWYASDHGLTWHDDDLSALIGAQAPTADDMSPVIGYVWNDSENVAYLDAVGQVHVLWYASAAGPEWQHTNVNASAAAPPAAKGSRLAGYVWNNAENIAYLDGQGHVHVLWYADGLDWKHTAVTESAGAQASPAIKGSSICGYATKYAEDVAYLDDRGHVHVLWYADGQSWKHTAVTENAGAQGHPAAKGTSLVGYSRNGWEQISYIGTDNHVHALRWDDSQGANWHHLDLTANAHAPLAKAGSPLTGYVWVNPGHDSQNLFYIGADDHLHALWYDAADASTWRHLNVTESAGAPKPASSSGLTSYTWYNGQDRTEHVIYVDDQNHIHELWYLW